jgi:hypothetical protein
VRRPVGQILAFATLALTAALLIGLSALSSPLPWPEKTIRVYDATALPHIVSFATAEWNAAGAGPRFVLVRHSTDADVIVKAVANPGKTCDKDAAACVDEAGYWPFGQTHMYLPQVAAASLPAQQLRLRMLAAHEFGHVLGLKHRPVGSCSVMVPTLGSDRCSAPAQSIVIRTLPGCAYDSGLRQRLWCARERTERGVCGPTNRDLAAANELYAVAGPRPSYHSTCSLASRVAPPAPRIIRDLIRSPGLWAQTFDRSRELRKLYCSALLAGLHNRSDLYARTRHSCLHAALSATEQAAARRAGLLANSQAGRSSVHAPVVASLAPRAF